MTRARLVLACAALVLVAACGGGIGDRGSDGYINGKSSIRTVDPGDRVKGPVLEGDDLDGRPLSTTDFAGETIVVNVWGSWCAPCVKEAPVLSAVSKEYADKGVQFVGVDVRDNVNAAKSFNRKYDVTYPSIDDRSGSTLLGFAESLPSQAIPTTWIIDAEGRVAVRILGEVTRTTLSDLVDYVQKSTR